MTIEEELAQLREEKSALHKAFRRKDEELEQSHQANQDLREGLKQTIIAIGSQQERVQVLEGLIDALQERIKTLERHQAKESHNSSLPPSSDRFVRPPTNLRKKSGRSLVGSRGTGGIICGKWTTPIRFSSMQSSAVSTASRICVSNQQPCQSGVKCWTCQSSGFGSPNIGWKKSSVRCVPI